MNIKVLTSMEAYDLGSDTKLYKNIEHVLYRATTGKAEKLQEIYDVFYGNEGIRNSFIEYGQADCTVKIKDKTDLEQVYLKGIVDGLRTFHTFMDFYSKTHPKFHTEVEENE